MSIRDRLRKLEEAAETETVVARCEGCGEEMRIREGILLNVACLEWQMHQDCPPVLLGPGPNPSEPGLYAHKKMSAWQMRLSCQAGKV